MAQPAQHRPRHTGGKVATLQYPTDPQVRFSMALNRLTALIARRTSERTILAGVVSSIGRTLDVDRCLILNIGLKAGTIHPLHEWRNPAAGTILPTRTEIPLQDFRHTAAFLKATHRDLVSHASRPDPRIIKDGAHIRVHTGLHVKSLLYHPFLFRSGRDPGYHLIALNQTRYHREWTPEEYKFLRDASQHVSLAIDKVRLVRELQEQSQQLKKHLALRRVLEKERKALMYRILNIQEMERNRIGSTLHDELGQLLVLAKLNLENADANPTAIGDALQRTQHYIGQALAGVRRMAVSLRPPALDHLGLSAALTMLADDVSNGGAGLKVKVHIGTTLPWLPPATEITLYRFVQEAMTNVLKHAHARRVTLSLRQDRATGRILLSVKDDGCGMARPQNAPQEGLGILGMKERLLQCGGTLKVLSSPGKGTELRALIPPPPGQ